MGEEELGNLMFVRGENEGTQGVREAQRGGNRKRGARKGVEVKELRMSTIFLSKNAAKSSAVMED